MSPGSTGLAQWKTMMEYWCHLQRCEGKKESCDVTLLYCTVTVELWCHNAALYCCDSQLSCDNTVHTEFTVEHVLLLTYSHLWECVSSYSLRNSIRLESLFLEGLHCSHQQAFSHDVACMTHSNGKWRFQLYSVHVNTSSGGGEIGRRSSMNSFYYFIWAWKYSFQGYSVLAWVFCPDDSEPIVGSTGGRPEDWSINSNPSFTVVWPWAGSPFTVDLFYHHRGVYSYHITSTCR